jgi:hypothetical protein
MLDYENLPEHIHTSVRGESLIIKKDPVNLRLRNLNAKIYIAMPSLEALNISGSGKIRSH